MDSHPYEVRVDVQSLWFKEYIYCLEFMRTISAANWATQRVAVHYQEWLEDMNIEPTRISYTGDPYNRHDGYFIVITFGSAKDAMLFKLAHGGK